MLVVKVCRHRDDCDDAGVDDSPGLQSYPVIINTCMPCLKLQADRRRSVSPNLPGTKKEQAPKYAPLSRRMNLQLL